jgi:hypothetical protein
MVRVFVTLIVIAPLTLCLGASSGLANATQTDEQTAEARVRQVLESLEPDNTLRFALERGDRGTGERRAWMGKMKEQHVKQASFRIHFFWGLKQKELRIADVKYLRRYYRFDSQINDRTALRRIRKSGMERDLTKAILLRARAFMARQERDLRLKRACGVLFLNLLDDEVLPILDEPLELKSNCRRFD